MDENWLWKWKHITTGGQKENDCFKNDGICSPWNTVFFTVGCFYCSSSCHEKCPSLIEWELTEFTHFYQEEKTFSLFEILECQRWRLYKETIVITTNTGKISIQTFTCILPTLVRNKDWKIECLKMVQKTNSRLFHTTFCKFFSSIWVLFGQFQSIHSGTERLICQPQKG